MIALVASVVPCTKLVTWGRVLPEMSMIFSMPSSTPFSGAAGVVRTFVVQRLAPSSSTTSVKVPPTSAESLTDLGMTVGALTWAFLCCGEKDRPR